ncbi:MAG: hypothetical protein GAK33_05298 [Burkholderia lata]|uniref:Uncharacterized protein n=1 Tax=Burkholderia lata (strain ATCC 17760 / DSM 23089 / LMG 22485 / NCIMB 9086 / R18194 / 383) TaxID=482957 RepID=A0A833UIV5_BURL3|nr:MAG: hypothetical protein GAK33_05298 [Burkholderia lata]
MSEIRWLELFNERCRPKNTKAIQGAEVGK